MVVPAAEEPNKIKERGAGEEQVLWILNRGLAVGNAASLKPHCVDRQLTCFVSLLISNLHNNTSLLVGKFVPEVTTEELPLLSGGFSWAG